MRKLCITMLMVLALAMLAAGVWSAQMFYDDFEPAYDGSIWQEGPVGWVAGTIHDHLSLLDDNDPNDGGVNHIRTPGIDSAQLKSDFRNVFNSQHRLDMAYMDDVYLKCWIFGDNEQPHPQPWWSPEEKEKWPNGYITLLDTENVGDFFNVGLNGRAGQPTSNFLFFDYCSIETLTDGAVALNGQNGTVSTPRRQGWRKFTIILHPYTGNPGDVQFLIDDRLVYSGRRAANPVNPTETVPVDTIVLGAKAWTVENYWYDHVEFGTLDTPVVCNRISEAMDQPDGAWVQLNYKVVGARFTKSPFPGYITVEEDDRSSGLWVSSSYEANVSLTTHEAERITVKGIMCTNPAGMRYLDAIQITRDVLTSAQPEIVGCSSRSLGGNLLDGMLVKVWGKVINVPGSSPATVKGQERRGDWRRFFLITDGSSSSPIKIYYDNIISGTDPVPVVSNGDYVSVVGVAGTEAMTVGGPAEKGVWIRKANDLRIIRDVP